MPSFKGPQIRNYVRRAFREAVDPSPGKKAVASIWRFFDNACAYCGHALDRKKKEGHVDHLVSASRGGANSVANRVLACAACNEKEKLDRDWAEFLRAKNPDTAVHDQRKRRIVEWCAQHNALAMTVESAIVKAADDAADEVIAILNVRLADVRNRARAARAQVHAP